jgi:hypothetical protein
MSDDTDPLVTIARAARDLLDLYAREPELFRRVCKLLTPQDIETLHEVATWDRDGPDDDDALLPCGHPNTGAGDQYVSRCETCGKEWA